MQIARSIWSSDEIYKGISVYIREKISQMILFNVKINRVLNACQIKNIEINLRNIDLL